MPRKKKPARIWLKERTGREPRWIILDAGQQFDTGYGESDERKAQDKLALHLATRHRPDTSQRDPAKIKIAEILTLYMRDIAPTTASPQLIGYHADHLLAFMGKKSKAQLNGQLCRAYETERKQQGVKPSTIRRELVTLQAAVNHWNGETETGVVQKLWKPAESQPRPRYLTRTEAAKLLLAARKLGFRHVARFILIGIYTGTRHAAILGLRWQPSEDAGHIDVDGVRIYRMGSGEQETDKRRTPARIPNRLMAHVRIWYRNDMAEGPQTAIVRWNGKPMKKERRAWAKIIEEAKISDDITPHILRHTCATWGLQSGVEGWDIAGLTGMSLKTLERVYGHHDPEYQIGVAKAFRRAS